MIQLTRLHINYLLSEKVFLFTIFLIGLSSIFLLYSANVGVSESTMMFYQEYYTKQLMIEMLNFGKILVIVYLLFMMIMGYVIHQYDVMILNRVGIIKLKCSKMLAMWFFVLYLITIYFMIFVIIGVYITPFMVISNQYFVIYGEFLFFGFFYTMVFVYLYEISKHLLGLIAGFMFYLIVFIGSVDDIQKEDVSKGMQYLYRILLDLGYYQGEGVGFYYDKIYYLALILGSGLIVYFLRKNADLIN
ncbi:MAG: hypothetical protein ACVCEJ_06555 [Candidatus Izemoplasmataceae bacterium]